MLPGTLNIEITAGDGYRNTITFQDTDEQALDLTGYEFRAQIRKNAKSEVAVDFVIDDTDLATGTIVMSLPGDDVRGLGIGTSRWDLEYVVNNSDPTTVLAGIFKVVADITRPDEGEPV